MIPNLTWDGLGNSWDSLTSDPDAQWNLATLSVLDYLKFGVSESSSLIQSFSTRLDSLGVRVSEGIPDLFSQSTRPDSLGVRLGEASLIAGVILANDTLRVGVSEGATLLLARSDVLDTLMVGLTESADIAATLLTSDTLRLRVVEVTDSFLETLTPDALRTQLAEVAQIIVIMGSDSDFPFGKDDLTIALTEASVHCVVDWPNDTPISGVWTQDSNISTDPWTPRPPVSGTWSTRDPLTPQEEGCRP